MSTEVTLPVLGESVTEGTISRWLKAVGETVEVDEPLLEVSTDKVDTEIPSPVAGTLLEIRVAEDETAAVGAVLALVGNGAPAAAPEPAPVPPAEPPASPAPAAPPRLPLLRGPQAAGLVRREPVLWPGQGRFQQAVVPRRRAVVVLERRAVGQEPRWPRRLPQEQHRQPLHRPR